MPSKPLRAMPTSGLAPSSGTTPAPGRGGSCEGCPYPCNANTSRNMSPRYPWRAVVTRAQLSRKPRKAVALALGRDARRPRVSGPVLLFAAPAFSLSRPSGQKPTDARRLKKSETGSECFARDEVRADRSGAGCAPRLQLEVDLLQARLRGPSTTRCLSGCRLADLGDLRRLAPEHHAGHGRYPGGSADADLPDVSPARAIGEGPSRPNPIICLLSIRQRPASPKHGVPGAPAQPPRRDEPDTCARSGGVGVGSRPSRAKKSVPRRPARRIAQSEL